MRFYLGVHRPQWLEIADVPLFVSYRTLARRCRLPRARTGWALDSGAFSELLQHGRWTVPAASFAAGVRRCQAEIGHLEWAAIQDWMCEPAMRQRTGLSVAEHQARTIASLLDLRSLAPEIPWIPVLQGYRLGDYLDHAAAYERAGIALDREPLVGLGSVCRRQATGEIARIVGALASADLALHGFGVKTLGLARYGRHLASGDSMAWSYRARRSAPLPGCLHRNCANCWRYGRQWYGRVMRQLVTAETSGRTQLAWGWAS